MLVKRDDQIVHIPDCVCIYYLAIRVLEHPRCPTHGTGRDTWRVVGLPSERLRPGE